MIIVTHQNPDLDAICAVWLLKRFGGRTFEKAHVAFVPAGETYRGLPVDHDPNVVHVDTGKGKLDHHQSNAYTCAAAKVLAVLWQNDPVLKRMVAVVVADDHAKDIERADAAEDLWQFWFHDILSGWKMRSDGSDNEHLEWGMRMLDGVYAVMVKKVAAEKELAGVKGFQTPWGKGIAVETTNDRVLDVGIRQGFALVVRKDPRKQYVRITGRTDKGVDLTQAFNTLQELDPDATWYLHPSKVLIRNGSTKNPKMRPTHLSLSAIVEVITGLKRSGK